MLLYVLFGGRGCCITDGIIWMSVLYIRNDLELGSMCLWADLVLLVSMESMLMRVTCTEYLEVVSCLHWW